MPDETLRRIAWRDLFPWFFLILRSATLALEVRKLFVSTVAILLTGLGCWVFGLLMGLEKPPWDANFGVASQSLFTGNIEDGPSSTEQLLGQQVDPLSGIWRQLSDPFVHLFGMRKPQVVDYCFALLCGLWALIVWSLFGGIITRMAALQLGREERASLGECWHHALSKWSSYFSAPLYPLVAVALLTLPMIVGGLVAAIPNIGLVVAGILWPLQMLAALLVTLVLVGLLFGWPLMWATIGTEESDSFDALSRSYGYVYQRPLHYVFFVSLAAVLGYAVWWLVMKFASLVAYFTVWSAAWGCGSDRAGEIVATVNPLVRVQILPGWPVEHTAGSPLLGMDYFGAGLIAMWLGLVFVAALSYGYSYFWTVSTAIYLLLRLELDGNELDDVHVDEDEEFSELPPFSQDEQGLPTLGAETETSEASSDDQSEASETSEDSSSGETETSNDETTEADDSKEKESGTDDNAESKSDSEFVD